MKGFLGKKELIYFKKYINSFYYLALKSKREYRKSCVNKSFRDKI